jgi:hypothetical protein
MSVSTETIALAMATPAEGPVLPGSEEIEFHEATAIVDGDEGRVLCFEVIGPMIFAASNWFRRIDGQWRMIHHQAGPVALTPDRGEDEKRPQRLN